MAKSNAQSRQARAELAATMMRRAGIVKGAGFNNIANYQAGVRTGDQISPLIAEYGQFGSMQGVGNAMQRDRNVFEAPFGPQAPADPGFIDQPLPGQERPFPRTHQYSLTHNLPVGPDALRLVPTTTLRSLAQMYDIARKCIEVRKAEVASMEWDIVPRADADQSKGLTGYKSKPGVNNKYATEQRKMREFFRNPDRIGGRPMSEILKMGMEEVLVTDALSIHEVPTWGKQSGILGSDLHGIELIDGSTIKPLVDAGGRRPRYPDPAFQQFLWGLPRTELAAVALMLDAQDDPEIQAMQRGFPAVQIDKDGNSNVIPLRTDQLAYRVHNPRVWTQFGFSCTEQIIMNINLALRRQQWHTAYFTEGDIPAMLVHVPDTWNLDQISRYETMWHSMLGGDAGWKHRMRAIPGVEKVEQMKPPVHKMDFDDFLMHVTCAGYNVDPTAIGFQKDAPNNQESNESTNYRIALSPMLRWWAEYFDELISRRLHQPELLFQFARIELEDEKMETDIDAAKIKVGMMTLDEARTKRGAAPYDLEQSRLPNIYLTRDVVPLSKVGVLTESKEQQDANAGVNANAPKTPSTSTGPAATDGAGGVEGLGQHTPTAGSVPRKSPPQKNSGPASSTARKVADALDELKTFERFIAKNATRSRKFNPETLPHSLVDSVYERVAQGEISRDVFADVRKKQAYAADAIIGEIFEAMV